MKMILILQTSISRMMRWDRICFLFAIFTVLLIISPPLVKAHQQSSNRYSDGADIVFVVDQSGSMSGASGRAPSDPFDLRADAVRYVIERIGITKLYFNQQSRYRIGVVSFGDSARVDLPLTEISAINADGWTQERKNLQSAVKSEPLGFTNIAEGLRVAHDEVFNQADPIPGDRAKVVIVLTDGRPDLQEGPDQTDDTATYFRRTLLPQVQNQFPKSDYLFYIVAIDDINDFWPTTESYWSQMSASRGRALRLAGSTEMPAAFTGILEDFIHTQAVKLTPGPFQMPAYLQRVIFTILKSSPTAGAQIVRPDGVALTQGGNVDIRSNGSLIQLIEVSRPVPGQWTITVDSNTRYDIYFEPVQATIQRIEPSRDLAQNTETTLVFQVRDQGGIPLPEAAGYPLSLQLSLESPNGSLPSITLSRGSNDTYQTPSPVLLDRNGEWKAKVTATANGKSILQPSESTFNVFSTNRVDLTVRVPQNGDKSQVRNEPLGATIPLTVELRLLNDRGQPLSVSDVFPVSLDQAITATLRRANGALVQNVNLTEEALGVLKGNIPDLGVGDFRLEVTANDRTNQIYVLAPTSHNPVVSFTRIEHPGEANAELIRALSIGAPSALLALIIGWLIYMFSGRMRGRLVILKGASERDTFPLPRRRHAVWKQPPPVLALERIKIQANGKDRIRVIYRELNQRTWKNRDLDPERDFEIASNYSLKYTRK